ncbi:nitroreductase [Parabacteroides sp. PF5-5]|uniref:nitroreductase family protein n=1 Tax=unclassified Parabacteroides TaxID=2649774 RepID=UPI0024748B99|nr:MULTISPECIES: nitroreductase family protein [unclassified Parabacteroides]MDH6306750.1 nitroreductase [Parabacteroides sp. PH5-39]MDH6317894.1 nitroreductase [Parabacteroides sp. PF5-13]MDH6321397.1 nitroreductase [Parabacteroides sp. PH5-13]MDH6325129.1 nitroreductase [Parabacteroides sp. PH5-8]MDH6327433.1 nitroreductase [Parabacteroides sp. PH5-41]
MNFLELIRKRRAIRQFDSKEVEQEKLDYILECARFAPSAVNIQPWLFFIVKSEEKKKDLQKAYPNRWIDSAPFYIVACADSEQSWKRSYDSKNHVDVDLSIAIEHICLAAAEQGLGTCWVCNFDPIICSQALELSEHIHPVAIIPIGYHSSVVKPQVRKPIKEIVKTI